MGTVRGYVYLHLTKGWIKEPDLAPLHGFLDLQHQTLGSEKWGIKVA